MLDWLIIGGGLHGCHIARRLAMARPSAEVAVADPLPTAVTDWQRRADACGMHYLRSSQSHHLGLRSDSLRTYAHQHGYDGRHAMGRYRRPSRALFEAHALAVTEPVRRIKATVVTVESAGAHWRAVAAGGDNITARNIVLASGPAAPAWPDWGRDLPHVFASAFVTESANWNIDKHIVVVGAGISAAQYAIARSYDGHPVTLLTRHPPQQTAFDSQPCFAGPRCLDPFLHLPMTRRPAALAAARNPATMPADIYTELASRLALGAMRWVRGDITALDDNGPQLADGRRVHADHVVLATGFAAGAGALYERLAASLNLPLDEHGYAHIDSTLAWAPGLYATGRPASLQLGPMAGNIRGARLAGKKLAQVVTPNIGLASAG